MNDDQLLRYSRHILLDEIGIEGQERIIQSHALIIGAGGLGSPAALYLASAGVGTLTIADGDTVDLSNLQRQILHTEERIGELKTHSARQAIQERNPAIIIQTISEKLAQQSLTDAITLADIVLDCSDNFSTRYAVNAICHATKTPLVSGSAIRLSGQLATFDFRNDSSPCYHCLFPEGEDIEELRCAVTGVFAPLTGIIGSFQAAEALKILALPQTNQVTNEGKLHLFDALSATWRAIRFQKDLSCLVCGKH